MSCCPGEKTLRSLAAGAVGDLTFAAIEMHVESCPACKMVVEQLARNGSERSPLFLAPERWPDIPGFSIERELGRGAMGVVYLAHRDVPRRPVAIKLLPGGQRASQKERRQWLREAEAASLVRHPNVVTLYEVAEASDWFLLVLEFIPGGTLADRLSKPVAPADATRLIETIARAVHHIHLNNQLHLDLKPSNILLDGSNDAGWDAIIPKVSDFGDSQMNGPGNTDTTSASGRGGTPVLYETISRPRGNARCRCSCFTRAILCHAPEVGRRARASVLEPCRSRPASRGRFRHAGSSKSRRDLDDLP